MRAREAFAGDAAMKMQIAGFAWMMLIASIAHAQMVAEDGAVRLRLDDGGGVVGVSVDGRTLPTQGVGGFEVVDAQRVTPVESLPEPGFEEHGARWRLSGAASIASDARTGAACLSLRPDGGTAAAESAEISVIPGTFYCLSGHVRMEDASAPPVMRLRQYLPDGEELVAGEIHENEFPRDDRGGTHGWRYIAKGFFIMWRAETVRLSIAYEGKGRVCLDDLSLHRINRHHEAWTPLRGHLYERDGEVHQRAEAEELGLRLRARYHRVDGRLQVDGQIEDTTGEDRAVQVRFRLPVRLTGWRWFDDLRHERAIDGSAPCQRYIENVSGYTVGRWAKGRRPASTGKCRLISLFPFGAVGDARTGLALAQPMDRPRVFRVQHVPGEGLQITWDFGLSRAARAFPGSADFSFAIYRFPAEHGFRGALQRYYELFEHCFERRAEKDGLYGYFRGWLHLPHPEEFGMAFELGGAPQGKQYGSYTFCHPLGNECDIRGREGAWETGEHPDREEVIGVLHRALEAPAAREEAWWQDKYAGRYSVWAGRPFIDSVRRALNSGIHDDRGRYCINQYSANLPQVICDTDPEVQSPNMAEGEWEYYIRNGLRRYDVDGVDFDNVGDGTVKAYTDNYRREHFAAADIPLVFNYHSRRPTLHTQFCQYELIRQVRRSMLRRGRLMSGNVTALPFLFHAALMDKLGGEEGETFWAYYGTQFYPYGRYMAFRDYSRCLAGDKPVATLCSQGFKIHHPEAEGEMQRAEQILASSALTGTFANLNVGDMEPFRELYQRYVPAARPLSAAGWEPITHATVVGHEQLITEHAPDYAAYPTSVLIERFGTAREGDLHFCVYDTGADVDACQVALDADALGLPDADAIRATSVLTGDRLGVSEQDGAVKVHCPLSEMGLGIIAITQRPPQP